MCVCFRETAWEREGAGCMTAVLPTLEPLVSNVCECV